MRGTAEINTKNWMGVGRCMKLTPRCCCGASTLTIAVDWIACGSEVKEEEEEEKMSWGKNGGWCDDTRVFIEL